MNTILKLFLYLLKFLNFWILIVPERFKLLATFINFGIMHLMFGSSNLMYIKFHILADNDVAMFAVGILLGIPAFLGFAFFMAPIAPGSNINENINSLISHRNNMMHQASPAKAYEIMKKTSHLDVITSSPEFKNAVLGFNATVGKDGPSKAYNDMVNK